MKDRPRGSGSGTPEEGTPEYEWLYGERPAGSAGDDDRTRAIPTAHARAAGMRDDDPDTKVMPTMPEHRTARASAAAPGPTPRSRERGAAAPPPPRSRPASRADGRSRRPRLRWLVWLVALWLVFLVVVPLWTWSRIDKVDATPTGDRPADSAGTNFLIVGSDKADDLTAQQRKDLKTGPRGGTNTDTIIVLHTGAGPNTMMSIPRDTLTEIPGHGTGMINSAFSIGKAPLLVATVEKLTDLHIDHYVELGFGSVINTVDALGGVTICPKIDMVDPQARLDIKKGCQEVDGETALAYSRSRHVQALSDLARVGQQREVIAAIGDEVVSPWTVLNPVRYVRLNNAAGNSIRIDRGMSPISLARFALAMTGSRKTCTLPNVAAPSDPNRVVMDDARAKPLLAALRDGGDIPAASCTATGRARS